MHTYYPLSIFRYLRSVSRNTKNYVYLKLDENHHVIDFGGELQRFELSDLDFGMPIDAQFPALNNMLSTKNEPVVLLYVNISENRFIDIHIVNDPANQWVVLIDSTVEGRKRQAAQQQRLNDDLVSEHYREPVIQRGRN